MPRKNYGDVDAIRKKMADAKGGRMTDPNEFRPPQVKEGESFKFRFFILPPFEAGEKCADGEFTQTSELFYVQNGSHWINNKPYPCPRIHNDEECPMCSLGFELMGETQDKKMRSQIARQYLPQQKYAMNIYFPNDKANPEDLRGTVKWFNPGQSIYNKMEACIMNDDEGDPADPQAYGIFYDPYESYLFQLVVGFKGGYRNYDESKFLASVGKRPIAAKDKKPLESRIDEILAQRHDLFTKFDEPDTDKLASLVKSMTNGDGDGDDDGFDDDDDSVDESVKADDDVVIEDEEDATEDAEDAVEEEPKAKTKEKKKAKEEPKEEPEETVAEDDSSDDSDGSDGGEDDDELASLMAQLGEDD